MESKEIDDLERLIDRHTLSMVVNVLAIIARGKAQHIEENWQDPRTARPWDRMAGRLETVARACTDNGV